MIKITPKVAAIFKQLPLIHCATHWVRQSVWSLYIRTMQQILAFCCLILKIESYFNSGAPTRHSFPPSPCKAHHILNVRLLILVLQRCPCTSTSEEWTGNPQVTHGLGPLLSHRVFRGHKSHEIHQFLLSSKAFVLLPLLRGVIRGSVAIVCIIGLLMLADKVDWTCSTLTL